MLLQITGPGRLGGWGMPKTARGVAGVRRNTGANGFRG